MNFSCDCGATDCRHCGPAQGHQVTRAWLDGRYQLVNPEDASEEGDDFEPDYAAMAEDGRMSL